MLPSLSTAVMLLILPFLVDSYIRVPLHAAGYLPESTSTPVYPAGYLSKTTSTPVYPAGYLPEPTSTPVYPTGYLSEPTSRRRGESTTSRLSYDRIYSGASRRRSSPSSKVDRSSRGHPYRFHSPATKSDRVSLVETLDRSETYQAGGGGDVCGDFQTIGLGASAASLLAFLVYILLTNGLTSTVASTPATTTARQTAGAHPWLARTAVTATCTAADLLDGHRSAERPWDRKPAAQPDGHPEEHSNGYPDDTMTVRPLVHAGNSSEDSGETSSEDESLGEESPLGRTSSGAIGSSRLSSVAPQSRHDGVSSSTLRRFGAPPSRGSHVSPRQFGDDCFSEMIGALAGLAGLGALSGFSLSQSAQALLTSMMTIAAMTSSSTTTTTTTTTTGTGTGRFMAGKAKCGRQVR